MGTKTKNQLLFILATLILFVVHPARSEVIASCGPLEGYSYYLGNEQVGIKPEWVSGPMHSTTVFVGTGQIEDVILKSTLKGEDWTRSASDYKAHVLEVFRNGPVRQVLVLWGPVTEVYALDTANKTLTLVAQKSGLVKVVHAYAGKCE